MSGKNTASRKDDAALHPRIMLCGFWAAAIFASFDQLRVAGKKSCLQDAIWWMTVVPFKSVLQSWTLT